MLQRQRIGDIVENADMRKQRERLWHVADAALGGRNIGNVAVIDQDAPLTGLLKPNQQAQQHRFSGGRRAAQHRQPLRRDLHRHIVERLDTPIRLADALQTDPTHPPSRAR